MLLKRATPSHQAITGFTSSKGFHARSESWNPPGSIGMADGVQNEEQVYPLAHTLGSIDDLRQAFSSDAASRCSHNHEPLCTRACAGIQDLYPGIRQLVLQQPLAAIAALCRVLTLEDTVAKRRLSAVSLIFR